jgi:hypothetical protein
MIEAIKNIAAQANSIDAKYAANHEWFDSITDIYEGLDAPDEPAPAIINPISEGLAYPAIDIPVDDSPTGHADPHAALLAALGL